MIEIVIDDYADPRAERTVTVQSFKRQMGTEGHYPVKYGVATNFPGTVTLRWATGSATVTDGSRVTTWLDEGSMVVTADATGAVVENGTYYLYLLQDESQKELQLAIVVALEYYAIPELGISPTAQQGSVTADAANPCQAPDPLYSLVVSGYRIRMSHTAALFPLWGDNLMEAWQFVRDGPGVFRTFSVVPLPFAVSNSATDYCYLSFEPLAGSGATGRSFTVTGDVPVPTFTWSRSGDVLVVSSTDFLRCSCQWLVNGDVSVRIGARVYVLPPQGTALYYSATVTDHGESVTFSKTGTLVTAQECYAFLAGIAAGAAPSFSHETIPYVVGARVMVQVAVYVGDVSAVPIRYNHIVINSLP